MLEFPAVLDLLAAEAASVLGRQRAASLRPTSVAEEVGRRLAETRECRSLLRRGPFAGLERAADIRPALARAAIAGARLAPADLLAIADTVEAAVTLRRQLRQGDLPLPTLLRYAERLRPPAEVGGRIRQCILPDGTVADAASPTLLRLRGRARQLREGAREILQGLLSAPRLAGVIAEPVITLRNDRYVIPVTPAYHGLLPGVVQDQSGSGQTLFLEPMAVVEANNLIRRVEREAEAEVDRLLAELTELVRSHGEAVAETVEAVADLDLAQAKARLAERWDAAEPTVAPGARLQLFRIRHPLLLEARRAKGALAEPVVPIDVVLPPDVRVLVITGPNTGGKTVTLKTVGLTALMAQAGMHLPASADSVLPLVSAVYADIGDEQSIAQDLSTFSAHVLRLKSVLAQSDATSLVLMDELGAGTDPGEGAALGAAVLEELAEQGCHVLATTHLDGLKLFVTQDPRMVNGAVEFDLDRFQPGYKLHIGIPGRSFALDIASRLGISPTTIARARQLVGETSAGIAALLDRLHVLERERSADAEAAAREREASQASRLAVEALLADLRDQRDSLKTRAERLVAQIAAEARRRAEAAVAGLRQGQPIQAARQAIADIRGVAEEILADLPELSEAPEKGGSLDAVVSGQRVWVRHLNQAGTVLTPPGPQGLVEVQLGVGRTRVPLEKLASASPSPVKRETVISWRAGAGDALQAEINVIGCTVEEASGRVGRYLEDAMLGGLTRVRIIHGKGTGRLRRGLAAFLHTHPLVASFQLASFEAGGAGATVVDLGSKPAPAGEAATGEAGVA
ncbi:MAG: endonuclease MutS2 [candidate division NC10 bacterium]|nr:endonuclease MutS2 [candidate division NC10 bacterium]